MVKIIHKTSLHIVGYLSIVVGVAGLVLPIIPGIICIAIGIFFFTRASEHFNAKIELIKNRYPRFGQHYDIFDSKVNRFIKRAY